MNLDEKFPVSPAKVEALKARLRSLGIDPRAIEEQFIRGGGPGGQKVNKTSSAVLLRYAPLEIVVRCRRERSRSLNRFLALRELADEVEARVSPATSSRLREIDRASRAKARAGRRARARHHAPEGPATRSPSSGPLPGTPPREISGPPRSC